MSLQFLFKGINFFDIFDTIDYIFIVLVFFFSKFQQINFFTTQNQTKGSQKVTLGGL